MSRQWVKYSFAKFYSGLSVKEGIAPKWTTTPRPWRELSDWLQVWKDDGTVHAAVVEKYVTNPFPFMGPAGNEKVLWFSMEDKWKDFFTSFSFCNNGLFLNGRTLTIRCNSRTCDGIWFKQDDWCAILRNLWHTIIGGMWPQLWSLPTILRPFKGPWF